MSKTEFTNDPLKYDQLIDGIWKKTPLIGRKMVIHGFVSAISSGNNSKCTSWQLTSRRHSGRHHSTEESCIYNQSELNLNHNFITL